MTSSFIILSSVVGLKTPPGLKHRIRAMFQEPCQEPCLDVGCHDSDVAAKGTPKSPGAA